MFKFGGEAFVEEFHMRHSRTAGAYLILKNACNINKYKTWHFRKVYSNMDIACNFGVFI